MKANNRELVENFYESIAQGNFEQAIDIFADNLVWVEPPFPGHPGGVFLGKNNAIEGALSKFIATWKDLMVKPERILASKNEVVVLGRYFGRHAVTDRLFEARFSHVWSFEAHKAVRFEMLADTIQFFRAAVPKSFSSTEIESPREL